jgi:type IV secretion system protein TrbL
VSFLTGILGSAAGAVGGGILAVVEHAVMSSLSNLLASVGTMWVRIKTPDLASVSNGTPSDAVAYVQDHLVWLQAIACLVGAGLACGRIAIRHRREGAQAIARGFVNVVVVHAIGLTAIATLTTFSDGLATWVLDGAIPAGQTFGGELTSTVAISSTAGLSAITVIVLELVGIMMALLQLVLMFVRVGMLTILAGVLNFSASLSFTETGNQAWRKHLSWLVAFLAYKPVAAVVYATAFRLGSTSTGGDAVLNCVSGLFLFGISIVALPALMRFISPHVAGTAAGSAGGVVALGAGAAALAIPTGAALASRGRGAGGISGMGSGSGAGPSGASPLTSTGAGSAGQSTAGAAGTASTALAPVMLAAQAAQTAGGVATAAIRDGVAPTGGAAGEGQS